MRKTRKPTEAERAEFIAQFSNTPEYQTIKQLAWLRFRTPDQQRTYENLVAIREHDLENSKFVIDDTGLRVKI